MAQHLVIELPRQPHHAQKSASPASVTDARQPIAASDRRRAPRKKVLLRGKLVWEGLTQLIDCTIRDISASGAGIRLFEDRNVPKCVVLVAMRDGVAYEAEVQWYSRSNLGLRFRRSFSLDAPLPSELNIPKTLWDRSQLYADANGTRSPDIVTVYRGFRISIVADDGGFVAYAKDLESPIDPGINLGKKVLGMRHPSAVAALRAAKLALDAGDV